MAVDDARVGADDEGAGHLEPRGAGLRQARAVDARRHGHVTRSVLPRGGQRPA